MLAQSHLEQIVYLLILSLILSIIINLYFANNRLRSKLQEKHIDKIKPKIIQQFLKDQANKTANAKRHNQRKHLSKAVIALRNAYLNIEQKAIDKEIDSKEYWNLINNNVKKLLDIISEHQKSQPIQAILDKISAIRETVQKSAHSDKAQSVLQSLEKFEAICVSHSQDPEKLNKMGAKLDSLFQKLSSAAYRKLTETTKYGEDFASANRAAITSMKESIHLSSAAASNLAKINPNDFDFSLDSFNHNHKSLEQGLDRVEKNINTITKQHHSIEATIIKASDQQIKKSNRDLDELYEQIQEENEREIERLRSTVKNQKNIIFELEDSIARLEDIQTSTVAPENKEREESIQQLKNCLRDAELCINTLEQELDNLKRNQIECRSTTLEDPVTDPLNASHLASLENTIDALKNEVQEAKEAQSIHEQTMLFLGDCLDANSIEDISLSLFQTVNEMGWHSALVIKNDNRNMEIDPNGLLNTHAKTLIQNMQSGEINSKRNGEEISFHFPHLWGKLEAQSASDATTERQKSIIELLKITDKMLAKIKSNLVVRLQRKRLQDSANTVKKLAMEVDTTIDTINRRSRDSISTSFGQIQDIARSKGLKASQIASFRNLEQQTLDELAADQSLRLKVKKEFLLILKNLEDD